MPRENEPVVVVQFSIHELERLEEVCDDFLENSNGAHESWDEITEIHARLRAMIKYLEPDPNDWGAFSACSKAIEDKNREK